MPRRIYADFAAATPLDPRVREAMLPYVDECFGNPSSVHAEGRAAKKAVEEARSAVAGAIGARPNEMIFTNGVTEAINLALLGVVKASGVVRPHVVTVATEHMAVVRTLEQSGADVTVLSVAKDGSVSVDDVLAAIRSETVLVNVMYANNEIGTIAPLAEIGKGIAKLRKPQGTAYPLLHTDAAQAACFLDLNVEKLHVDLMSLSGQKMYGPKATGALYVRAGVALSPLLFGGRQEHGLRPGTENVPGIVGFATALTIAQHERESFSTDMTILRNQLMDGLLAIDGAVLNGPHEQRLPNNVNVSIPGVDGEALVMYLDQRGIAAATSSSCTSGAGLSHVIAALGTSEACRKGSIRFSLGRGMTNADIASIIAACKEVIPLVRTA